MSRPHCLNRADCAAKSPVTHCRRCSILRVGNDPALEAKRLAGIESLFSDPAYVAAQRERLQAGIAKALRDPAFIERKREQGRRQYRDYLSRPDILARNRSPEVRKAAGRKSSETRMGWCPPELRAEYRRLIRSKLLAAAEARRIIEAEIAGTAEHGKREVASNDLQMRLKHERMKAQEY